MWSPSNRARDFRDRPCLHRHRQGDEPTIRRSRDRIANLLWRPRNASRDNRLWDCLHRSRDIFIPTVGRRWNLIPDGLRCPGNASGKFRKRRFIARKRRCPADCRSGGGNGRSLRRPYRRSRRHNRNGNECLDRRNTKAGQPAYCRWRRCCCFDFRNRAFGNAMKT